MQLTTNSIAKYIGGQMEIQNQGENYIYRGEIKTIAVEDDTLKVGFVWLAKGDSLPPTKWQNHDDLDYATSLGICHVFDIGDDRIALHIPIVCELTVLFPPGGSKLDPSKVEGLKLS